MEEKRISYVCNGVFNSVLWLYHIRLWNGSPGQSVWDLWQTKWHWNRYIAEHFSFPQSVIILSMTHINLSLVLRLDNKHLHTAAPQRRGLLCHTRIKKHLWAQRRKFTHQTVTDGIKRNVLNIATVAPSYCVKYRVFCIRSTITSAEMCMCKLSPSLQYSHSVRAGPTN